MGTLMMTQQESLFSTLAATDQMFEVGDTVFEVVLGEVRPLVVTGTFEVTDRCETFGGNTVRYDADYLTGGHHVFGKYDVGKYIFATEQDALAQVTINLADKNVHTILMNPADADEWIAYRENGTSEGRHQPLYACFARFGNMVYQKGCMNYHFMNEYADEKTAKREYRKLTKNVTGKPEDEFNGCSPAPLEIVTLYGRGDGKWAQCDYAFNQWYDGYFKRWIQGRYNID